MTAAELIALLKSRPVACGRLSIETYTDTAGPSNHAVWLDAEHDDAGNIKVFHEWLTGAAVNWCDERGIDTQISRLGNWYATTGREEEEITLADGHPSRLHALLAAIEASQETTT
jgi:hypothetical protein